MKIVKYLATLVALLVSFSVQAVCPVQETTIEYVNGIDTKWEDADNSRKKVEEEILNVPTVNPDCIHSDLAYNTNEPLFLDFLEGGLQRAEEVEGRIESFWESYFRTRVPFSAFNGLVDTLFFNTTFAIEAGEFILGPQLDEHLAHYQLQLGAGRRLILVGHSQGNLYTNEAWSRFTFAERDNVRVVAVATPSDTVAGSGGPYTTLHRDTLATTLFAAIGALPSNTPMTRECADTIVGVIPVPWLCHGFKEAYMLGDEPRTQIVNDIVALLPSPPKAFVLDISPSPSYWSRTLISSAQFGFAGLRFMPDENITFNSVSFYTAKYSIGPENDPTGDVIAYVLPSGWSSLEDSISFCQMPAPSTYDSWDGIAAMAPDDGSWQQCVLDSPVSLLKDIQYEVLLVWFHGSTEETDPSRIANVAIGTNIGDGFEQGKDIVYGYYDGSVNYQQHPSGGESPNIRLDFVVAPN